MAWKHDNQAVLDNSKIASGLMSATLAMPNKLCFIQRRLLFSPQHGPFSLSSLFLPHPPRSILPTQKLVIPIYAPACLHVVAENALLSSHSCLFQRSQIPPAGNRVSALRRMCRTCSTPSLLGKGTPGWNHNVLLSSQDSHRSSCSDYPVTWGWLLTCQFEWTNGTWNPGGSKISLS